MPAHTCTTVEGTQVTCLCSTGRDHGQDEMDLESTLTDTVADRPDIITGMADAPAEIIQDTPAS